MYKTLNNEFWVIIIIGIFNSLARTRYSYEIPKNLHIKVSTGRYYIAHMALFTFV